MCVYNNCSLGIYYMQCVFTTKLFGYLLYAVCVIVYCNMVYV